MSGFLSFVKKKKTVINMCNSFLPISVVVLEIVDSYIAQTAKNTVSYLVINHFGEAYQE